MTQAEYDAASRAINAEYELRLTLIPAIVNGGEGAADRLERWLSRRFDALDAEFMREPAPIAPVAFVCPKGYGECENAGACVYPGRCWKGGSV